MNIRREIRREIENGVAVVAVVHGEPGACGFSFELQVTGMDPSRPSGVETVQFDHTDIEKVQALIAFAALPNKVPAPPAVEPLKLDGSEDLEVA